MEILLGRLALNIGIDPVATLAKDLNNQPHHLQLDGLDVNVSCATRHPL